MPYSHHMETKFIQSPVAEAVRKAGGQAVVARHFGIKPPSVSEWIVQGCIPANRCIEMEKLTGIRCEMLNQTIDWRYLRATDCPVPVKEAA